MEVGSFVQSSFVWFRLFLTPHSTGRMKYMALLIWRTYLSQHWNLSSLCCFTLTCLCFLLLLSSWQIALCSEVHFTMLFKFQRILCRIVFNAIFLSSLCYILLWSCSWTESISSMDNLWTYQLCCPLVFLLLGSPARHIVHRGQHHSIIYWEGRILDCFLIWNLFVAKFSVDKHDSIHVYSFTIISNNTWSMSDS